MKNTRTFWQWLPWHPSKENRQEADCVVYQKIDFYLNQSSNQYHLLLCQPTAVPRPVLRENRTEDVASCPMVVLDTPRLEQLIFTLKCLLVKQRHLQQPRSLSRYSMTDLSQLYSKIDNLETNDTEDDDKDEWYNSF